MCCCAEQAKDELDGDWNSKSTADKAALGALHTELSALKSTLDEEVAAFEAEKAVRAAMHTALLYKCCMLRRALLQVLSAASCIATSAACCVVHCYKCCVLRRALLQVLRAASCIAECCVLRRVLLQVLRAAHCYSYKCCVLRRALLQVLRAACIAEC